MYKNRASFIILPANEDRFGIGVLLPLKNYVDFAWLRVIWLNFNCFQLFFQTYCFAPLGIAAGGSVLDPICEQCKRELTATLKHWTHKMSAFILYLCDTTASNCIYYEPEKGTHPKKDILQFGLPIFSNMFPSFLYLFMQIRGVLSQCFQNSIHLI